MCRSLEEQLHCGGEELQLDERALLVEAVEERLEQLVRVVNALRVLAKELGVNYDIFDALQSDNARLRGVLTGKESDVETQDD